MDLMHIPLCELSIAKTNVRHGVKKADYEDLTPTHFGRFNLRPLPNSKPALRPCVELVA